MIAPGVRLHGALEERLTDCFHAAITDFALEAQCGEQEPVRGERYQHQHDGCQFGHGTTPDENRDTDNHDDCEYQVQAPGTFPGGEFSPQLFVHVCVSLQRAELS